MYRLQPDRAIPHPLEPAGVLGAGGGALETPCALAEVGRRTEAARPVESVAGLRRCEPAPEEGPGGAEEVARGRHRGVLV